MTPAALVAILLELTGAPATKTLRARAERLAPVLVEAAASVEPPFDPVMLGAIAFQESGFNLRKKGKAGEIGALQVKPDGMARYLCRGLRLWRVRDNAKCAVRILANARRICGDEPRRFLASYNGTRRCCTSGYARRVLEVLQRRR